MLCLDPSTRRPVSIDRNATIETASRLMREKQVLELVVTERQEGARVAAGVISAYDIVSRVVALGLQPAVMTTGDLLGVKGVVSLDDLLRALASSEFSGAHRFHR